MFICPGEAPKVLQPQTPIHLLRLKPACSTTSQHFHLLPRYESHEVSINILLITANVNVVNISAPEFRIWQHLEDHWNRTLLQHLANIPSVSLDDLYKQMITSSRSMNPFLSTNEKTGDTASFLDTVFLCGNLCHSYRVAYTSRIRDILFAISFGANLPD